MGPNVPDDRERPRIEALRPTMPAPEFPFPPVLPADPEERAEVLRRFEKWHGKPKRILPEHLSPAVLPDDPAEMAELLRGFAEWQDIPQEARALVLRTLWPQIIDHYLPERGGMADVPAARRLLDAGADPHELATAMRAAAYTAVQNLLYRIDAMGDDGSPPQAPGWMLVEIQTTDDGGYEPTGRHIGGLHESLLSADPSGREGSDLFS